MNIRFGIMGCGGISERFCGVLRTEKNVSIRAVAARDAQKAAAFAAKHSAEISCSYDELIEDDQVDIIYIGTVHHLHYEQIKRCLNSGKSVLCEKPMVLHGEEARECFALAKEKNLLLMEAMWVRCNPCVRKATQWVSEGLIGDVKLVTASFCFSTPYNPKSRAYDRLAGGAMYDVGVYVIEFASGVLGENPIHAAGAVQYADTGVDTYNSISLAFPGGAVASLSCGITAKTPHDGIIYGTNGSIALKDFWSAHDVSRYDNEGNLLESFHADFDDGFCYQIRHVVDLMEKNAIESNLIPWKDTIACADVFDTILEKKRSNK